VDVVDTEEEKKEEGKDNPKVKDDGRITGQG